MEDIKIAVIGAGKIVHSIHKEINETPIVVVEPPSQETYKIKPIPVMHIDPIDIKDGKQLRRERRAAERKKIKSLIQTKLK